MTFRTNEDGEATTETVLVVPVLLLLITMSIHFAIWYHASSVARAAAQEGLSSARLVGGNLDAGKSETETFLANYSSKVLTDSTVNVSDSDTAIRVEVRGYSAQIVPGLRLPVHAVAAGPIEEFRP